MLTHVMPDKFSVFVTDLARSRKFYTETLGFSPTVGKILSRAMPVFAQVTTSSSFSKILKESLSVVTAPISPFPT